MYDVVIKNVRCFPDKQIVPIKPITILVGENSSGKSTFLASTRLAWDIFHGKRQFDFNEDPFVLGSFDQIATYRGGKAGRAREFHVGLHIETKKETVIVSGCFASDEGKPKLSEWLFEADKYHVKATLGTQRPQTILISTPSGQSEITEAHRLAAFSYGMPDFFEILTFFLGNRTMSKTIEGKTPKGEEVEYLSKLAQGVSAALGTRPYAIAPIRTRPLITYDQLKDIPSPEGAHIPILLAKLSSTDKTAWAQLRQSLDAFGKTSGLFDDIEVRRMGKNQGDPFQLRVKIAGPLFNLVYVGYGVSQVLPIIVDALQARKGSTFLLQQPEVHLHPKAQAELGSFLSSIAKVNSTKFIIETHSDYLLDRIRMDIRDRKHLNEDDVVILYFERSGGAVNIHAIEIDKSGNVQNAPQGYRQFFLEEERRMLLGR